MSYSSTNVIKQVLGIYMDGVTVLSSNTFDLAYYTLNKIIFPTVGIKYRLEGLGSEAHEYATTTIHSYALVCKYACVPLLLHLLCYYLLSNRLYMGSAFFIIHVSIVQSILMILTKQKRRRNGQEHDEEVTKSAVHKFVDPISDLTRSYLTSAVFHYVIYQSLLTRQFALFRLLGHLLWLSYLIGIDNLSAQGSFDKRVEHYHTHWIWYFGFSLMPAIILTFSKPSALWCSLMLPLMMTSANASVPKRYIPKEVRFVTTCDENKLNGGGASGSTQGFASTNSFLAETDVEEMCAKFRWSAWAIDSVNWLLANLAPSKRKTASSRN